MFSTDVTPLLSKNNVRDWAELNQPQTAAFLQQVQRDNQSASLALAQSGLSELGATARNQQTIDYQKWVNEQNRKYRNRESALALVSGLGSTAGRRLGYGPSQLSNADPNAILQSLNGFFGGLDQVGDTANGYARSLAQIAQYMPGVSGAGRG